MISGSFPPSKSTLGDGVPSVFSFSICGCVCVCPLSGQLSLSTSPPCRAQGKHFHVKPRTTCIPHPPPPTPSTVNTGGRSVLSVVPAVCCYCDFRRSQNHTFPVFASILCSLPPLVTRLLEPRHLGYQVEAMSALAALTVCQGGVTVKQSLCQTKQTPRHSQPGAAAAGGGGLMSSAALEGIIK